MKRIAVDQDQVLANLLPEWIRRYNIDYDDNLTPDQVTNWNWHGIIKPECGKKIYNYLDDQELFENLPVIKDSQDVLYRLSKRYEIFVVTAPWNPQNVTPKSNWLLKHFDFIDSRNHVFTKNKSIVHADYLVDDRPSNFDNFSGIPLLYDAPHNQYENRFLRVDNWNYIAKYFGV